MQCVPNNETICQLCDHCFGTGLGDEAMDVENFYSIVAGTCFTLVGIWWGVVQYRQDWLKDDVKRRLAGGIYVSFLLPGVMALGAQIGGENFTQFERMVLLQSIDTHWREHLSALDYLRQGIHLRGYAQKQPKQEYKREAFELFGQLLDSVKNDVTKVLMTVRIQSSEQLEQAAVDMEERAESIANVTYTAPTESGEIEVTTDEASRHMPKFGVPTEVPRVGRNDPCPCGSGKKYKQCHGKLA